MTGFEVLILINTIFIVWIMFELKEMKQQLNQPKTEDHAHHTNCPLKEESALCK